MAVRAKMRLTSITELSWSPAPAPSQKMFKFSTIYDPSIPEDQRFMKATPSGSIEMQIDNPAAAEQFKLGEDYYVDFAPVPRTEAK